MPTQARYSRPVPARPFFNAKAQSGKGAACRARLRCAYGRTGCTSREDSARREDASPRGFSATHLIGVAFVVEEDEAVDPVDVGLFSADGGVFATSRFPNPVQQFPGFWFHFLDDNQRFLW